MSFSGRRSRTRGPGRLSPLLALLALVAASAAPAFDAAGPDRGAAPTVAGDPAQGWATSAPATAKLSPRVTRGVAAPLAVRPHAPERRATAHVVPAASSLRSRLPQAVPQRR